MKNLIIFCLLLFAFLGTNHLNAQWTTDTDVNTLVVDSEGGDMKAIGASNGKTFVVSWKVVSAPTNYELRLQILDVDGTQLLGSDGILISDAIPMSTFTVIWNIVTDSANNLYVGVTGTGGGEPVYIFKLDDSGSNLWTSDGINIGSGYVPTLLPLASGELLASWQSGSNAVMQKLDSDGNTVWANNQPIENGSSDTVPASFFELSNGDFISIFHSVTANIFSNLFSQRFNAEGVSQWVDPTQLSDHGTQWNIPYYGLQDGDVVYYAYKGSHNNRFDSYLQRLNPDGTTPWGINGADFDTNQTNFEMDTRIAYQPGGQDIWAVCTYTNTNQSEKGEYVQKFDKDTGARLLTDQAKVIYPISGNDNVHAGALQLIDNQPLFLLKSGFDNGGTPTSLSAVKLDENGDFAWPEEMRPLATYSASKSRIHFTKPVNGQNVAVFIEDKGVGERIYAQNSTEEILSNSDLNDNNSIFFKNPVAENWNVKSDNTIKSVSIYNVLGQSIFELKNNDSNEITLNTQNWDSGIYIINIRTKLGVISKHIIKN